MFELIGSVFIDLEICPWVQLQIVCVPYPNRTDGFSPHAGLWKVAARATVGYLELFASIYFFA